ncbi:MAG: DUF177 domain-containing protein [gamma proteobacterium symbiont of Bathyaustriella thionipta]|nr:DUF177 domain-containing protein [gamma proteobacterium symbiont of Bathyaustriella thionipta]
MHHFSRLRNVLVSDAGSVAVDLDFSVGVKRRPWIQGQLQTEVMLVCQRCMRPFLYSLQLDLSLLVVETEAEYDLLPEDVDPILADDSRLNLSQMLEDEMLLALPQVAMHEPDDCEVKMDQWTQADEPFVEPVNEPKENPFEILAGFKAEKTK